MVEVHYVILIFSTSLHNQTKLPWASVARGKARGVWPPWIFTHHTTNAFFTKQSFCENNPPQSLYNTLHNHCNSLLRWLKLRGRGDLGRVEAWIRSYFARK